MSDRAGARNFEIRCAKNGFWSFSVSGLRACFGVRDSDFGFFLIKKIGKPHDGPIPEPYKNRFRRRQKPEIAQDYKIGVSRVCQRLLDDGLAEQRGAASSVLVLRKPGDLLGDFRDRFGVEK